MRLAPGMIAPLALAAALPLAAHAAGSSSPTPPKPTETTTLCTDGLIYDSRTKSCVAPQQDSRLDDKTLYDAVREFAYAGQYGAASGALDAMTDQGDTRVLTYRGFIARKLGNIDAAMAFYDRALAADPGNLLARSYMGQGFVTEGKLELARAELTEIRTRGGRGTWAELSLRMAIESGRGYSY